MTSSIMSSMMSSYHTEYGIMNDVIIAQPIQRVHTTSTMEKAVRSMLLGGLSNSPIGNTPPGEAWLDFLDTRSGFCMLQDKFIGCVTPL